MLIQKSINQFLIFLTIIALGGCSSIAARANLGEVKSDLLKYEKSGAYARDFNSSMDEANKYIIARATHVKNPAIILDIDETSLSNWPELTANDFSFLLPGPCNNLPDGPCGIRAWQKRAAAKSFAATLVVFKNAQRQGVTIFFITGRDETARKATENNLRRAGYSGWQSLIMRPAGTKTPSASDYKAPQRALIEKRGYTIIANIGDQPSDLAGGHAEETFLIPNPFYRIP